MKCGLIWLVLGTAAVSSCSSARAQSPLAISGGGTGATTASQAITNLGLPIVSVVDYGATGNGSTNDTTAINNAMTHACLKAIPNNGCILYFPAGKYMTTGLSMPSYVNVGKETGEQQPLSN